MPTLDNPTAHAAESTASVAWLLSQPAAAAIVVAGYLCSTHDRFERVAFKVQRGDILLRAHAGAARKVLHDVAIPRECEIKTFYVVVRRKAAPVASTTHRFASIPDIEMG